MSHDNSARPSQTHDEPGIAGTPDETGIAGTPDWVCDDSLIDAPTLRELIGVGTTVTGEPFEAGNLRVLLHEAGTSNYMTHMVSPAKVWPTVAGVIDTHSVWCSLNEFSIGRSGKAADLCMVRAFGLDVDVQHPGVKSTGFASYEDAWTFILGPASELLGGQPVAVVFSGHGLQPVWKLASAEFIPRKKGATARVEAAFKGTGRRLQALAEEAGGALDSAFGPERVWRYPGSINRKDVDAPVPTCAWANPNGTPVQLTTFVDIAREVEETEKAKRAQKAAQRPAGTPTRHTGGQPCAYVRNMIDRWPTDQWIEGDRHNKMLSQAHRIAAAARLGCLPDPRDAEETLRQVFLAAVGDPARSQEVDNALAYGREVIAGRSLEQCMDELGEHEHATPFAPYDVEKAVLAAAGDGDTGGDDVPTQEGGGSPSGGAADPHDPILEKDVFEYSDITRHIRDQARRALVSPWSALFAELGKTILLTPWWVTIPSLVGSDDDPASLNSIITFVGASGAGKSKSSGSRFLDLRPDPADLPYMLTQADGTWGIRGETVEMVLKPRAVGSGEAITKLYVDLFKAPDEEDGRKVRTEARQHRRSVWVQWAEVDKLAAQLKRDTQTITAEERARWDGGTLGGVTKTAELNLTIDPHTYRGISTFNMQPTRAAKIMQEADGGFTQRIVWASSDDPLIPDDDPEPAPKIEVRLPRWSNDGRFPFRNPDGSPLRAHIEVDDEVRRDVRQTMRLRRQGKLPYVELDAHRNLNRLKLAAAVAAMHGSRRVTVEVWEYADKLLEHSDRVRASVQQELRTAEKRQHVARGVSDAVREEARDRTKAQKVEQAAASIEAWLRRQDGPRTRGDINSGGKAGSLRRVYLGEALGLLVSEGRVETIADGKATRYKLVDGDDE